MKKVLTDGLAESDYCLQGDRGSNNVMDVDPTCHHFIKFVGGEGASNTFRSSSSSPVFLQGGNNAWNWLYGGQGNDILIGGDNLQESKKTAMANFLSGGDGDDWIFSGHLSEGGLTGVNYLYGGNGNDFLISESHVDSHLFGDDGDDVLCSCGADQLSGGAGDDKFLLTGLTCAALTTGFKLANQPDKNYFASVDGGDGIDTVVLQQDAACLDLHQAIEAHRIQSVERFALANNYSGVEDTNAKALTLQTSDIPALNPLKNTFNSGNGWAGLLGSRFKSVVVDGNAYDTLTVTDGDWKDKGTLLSTDAFGKAQTYHVYNHAYYTYQLIVDADIQTRIHLVAGV